MLEMKKGHVVTIASTASFVAAPGLVDYCCSKVAALYLNDGTYNYSSLLDRVLISATQDSETSSSRAIQMARASARPAYTQHGTAPASSRVSKNSSRRVAIRWTLLPMSLEL
jgi:short-subunit dehydrogenase